MFIKLESVLLTHEYTEISWYQALTFVLPECQNEVYKSKKSPKMILYKI